MLIGAMLGVGSGVGSGVGGGDGVGVVPGVSTGVGMAEGAGLSAGVSVGVAVALGVPVGPGLGVAAGEVGTEARFCGSDMALTTKSSRLSLVSWPDPPAPPGSRSRLLPAAGAGAGRVSSHALAAVPQPTASIARLAPTARSATLPPAAAKPLAYRASAMAEKMPASLAISKWLRAGMGGVPVGQVALRVIVAPVAVTYTSSSPSTESAPDVGLYSSTNSSDAPVPPVISSLMSRWSTVTAAAERSPVKATGKARAGPMAASTIMPAENAARARRATGETRAIDSTTYLCTGGTQAPPSMAPSCLPRS